MNTLYSLLSYIGNSNKHPDIQKSCSSKDLLDSEITFPSHKILKVQLRRLSIDNHGQELLKLAGKSLKFIDLINILLSSDSSRSNLLNDALAKILNKGPLSIDIEILSFFLSKDMLFNYWVITHDKEMINYDSNKIKDELDNYLIHAKAQTNNFDEIKYLESQGPLIVDVLKRRFYNPPMNIYGYPYACYYGNLADLIINIIPYAKELIDPLISILEKDNDFWFSNCENGQVWVWNKFRICETLSCFGNSTDLSKYPNGLHAAMKFFTNFMECVEYHGNIDIVLNLVKYYGENAKEYIDVLFSSLRLRSKDRFSGLSTPHYKQFNRFVENICLTIKCILENDLEALEENQEIKIISESKEYYLRFSKNKNYNNENLYNTQFYCDNNKRTIQYYDNENLYNTQFYYDDNQRTI